MSSMRHIRLQRHKDKRRAKRHEAHIHTAASATATMRFSPGATMAHMVPQYMEVKRRPENDILLSSHKAIEHDDAMFENQKFKRITGQRSCLIYCLDATDWASRREVNEGDTTEVVLIVSIELYCDMDAVRRNHYQWMFDYLRRDAEFKPPIKGKSDGGKSGNHAMLGKIARFDAT